MPAAARLTDFHSCPMVTPGVPPIPHVGGPIIGPSAKTAPPYNLFGRGVFTHGGQTFMRLPSFKTISEAEI